MSDSLGPAKNLNVTLSLIDAKAQHTNVSTLVVDISDLQLFMILPDAIGLSLLGPDRDSMSKVSVIKHMPNFSLWLPSHLLQMSPGKIVCDIGREHTTGYILT
jgi:hypothetical protein